MQPKEWTRIAEEFNRLVGPESQRKPRQCRERWINVVDPGVKRGKWQLEEDLKIANTTNSTLSSKLQDIQDLHNKCQCCKCNT